MKCLTVPGLYGSGPDHWQSLWEANYGYERVEQGNWAKPLFQDWKGNLLAALAGSGGEGKVLVAHSLGCILVAKALAEAAPYASALFLVALPDPTILEALAPTFANPPFSPLGLPGILVYSEDDEHCRPERSRSLAAVWHLDAVCIGRKGHINALSGLGRWDEGHALLRGLMARPRT